MSTSGTPMSRIRGRDAALEQLARSLRKPTPDNVSLVGSRFIGKSTVLRQLAADLQEARTPFDLVCYWDLREGMPQDDLSFRRALAEHLRMALLSSDWAQHAKYLDPKDPEPSEAIDVVVSDSKARFLVIIDHFDRVTYARDLPKELWDFCASLARRKNFRFVIASCARLYDLIPTRDSKGSYFWELLKTQIVRPFNAEELEHVFGSLVERGFQFERGCTKQMMNMTGGHPRLVKEVLDALEVKGGRVIPVSEIAGAATELQGPMENVIRAILDDCSSETQGDLADLAAERLDFFGLSGERQAALRDRGFIEQDGQRVARKCDLVLRYAANHAGSVQDLKRLIATPDVEARFNRNLLELKLLMVSGGDPDLRSIVAHAVRGLGEGVTPILGLVRDIAKEAIQLGWKSEFPPQGVIPRETYEVLVESQQRGGAGVDVGTLSRADQLWARREILRVMCGDDKRPKLTKKLTRPTMLLIDYLFNAGNFGEHVKDKDTQAAKDSKPDLDFCVTLCVASVALFGRITKECQ